LHLSLLPILLELSRGSRTPVGLGRRAFSRSSALLDGEVRGGVHGCALGATAVVIHGMSMESSARSTGNSSTCGARSI